MREPRYPLPRVVLTLKEAHRTPHPRTPRTGREKGAGRFVSVFLGAFRAGVRYPTRRAGWHAGRGAGPTTGSFRPTRRGPIVVINVFAVCFAGFDNDPSAGSPTETLLRLLLPLNDKVQWTSRDVAGSEPPTSPRSEHFTGPFNR